MGKIIVDGIVMDVNDPRARQRAAAAGTAAAGGGGGGGRPNFGSLHGGGAPQQQQQRPAAAAAGPAAGGGAGSPLDLLAGYLGIAGKVWTTPAVPALGWAPTPIPLVWLAAFGLLAVTVGSSRLLVGGLIALAVYVHMQSTGGALPGAGGGGGGAPPAAPGGGGGGGRPGGAPGGGGGGGGGHTLGRRL
jgi:hypothetical protein